VHTQAPPQRAMPAVEEERRNLFHRI
jgi:hypothetical protein